MSTIAVAESITLISATFVYWNAGVNSKKIIIYYRDSKSLLINPFIMALLTLSAWIVFLPMYIFFRLKSLRQMLNKNILLVRC